MNNELIKTKTVAEFEGTELEIIDRNGTPWLRGSQIASALGYQAKHGDAVNKIYSRNKDEFTEEMTAVIPLPQIGRPLSQSEGGTQPVRVFSPRGCWLLGMFAKTAKAKDFRRWVLDVLEERNESNTGKLIFERKQTLTWNSHSTIGGHDQFKVCLKCDTVIGRKPHMDPWTFKEIRHCFRCGAQIVLMAECYLEIPIDYECPDNTIDIDKLFS